VGRATFTPGTIVNVDGSKLSIRRKVLDHVWQLEDRRTGRIVELEERAILEKFADGLLTIDGTGAIANCGPANINLTEPKFTKAKERLAYVLAVVDLPNTRSHFEAAISEVWEKSGGSGVKPSFIAVYRWKRKYLRANRDIRALVDNDAAKGNRRFEYAPKVVEICQFAIDVKFLKRPRGTISDVLNEAIGRIVEFNKSVPDALHLKYPTRRLIKRLIQQIPAIDKDTARYGWEAARKKYRSVKGHIVPTAPLERAEIDHTLLDLFVVDEIHFLPLGRPNLTICIDVFTRCILGLHIGFTSVGFTTVAECLKDCFRPKVRLKEQYKDIKHEWPAFGVMETLVVDNGGEFHSASLEQACLSLGIRLQTSPRKTPWAKPFVERFFGTLNRDFSHKFSGTTFQNVFEKGDYDPAKHAVITLSQLQTGIRKWIVDVYHQAPHRGLGTTPAAMWNSTIRFEDIPVADLDTHLDAVMGTAEKRVLTHRGIGYAGLVYNCRELADLRRREGDRLKVDIRVDESDIGAIYVLAPRTDRPIRVPCINPEYASGISAWQHEVFKRMQAERRPEQADVYGWIESRREIQKMFEEQFNHRKRKSSKRIGRFLDEMRSPNPILGDSYDVPRLETVHATKVQEANAVDHPAVSKATGPAVHSVRPKFKAVYKDGLHA
jgi:putative transposase